MSKEHYIQITSGNGPGECELLVFKLVEFITKDAANKGIVAKIIDSTNGVIRNGYSSVIMSFKGEYAKSYIQTWQGTILWICNSFIRKNVKRKNWFAGVNIIDSLSLECEIKQSDVKYETMRAGGPGGQHVNTTDSAVRAIHIPTGIRTVARDERSQHANKELALKRIRILFSAKVTKLNELKKENHWKNNKTLERGNAKRIFEGIKFKTKVNTSAME
jgi:peptide chain release factor